MTTGSSIALCLPRRDRALQEAPGADRKSTCPAVTVPSKRQKTPLASPLALLSPSSLRGTRHLLQVCLPYCHRAHQEAPYASRKSTCPTVTVPTKRHQALIASPLVLLSLCPPRGTRRHSQIRLALSWMPHTQSTAAVPAPPCSCPPRGPQLFLGEVQTTAQESAH